MNETPRHRWYQFSVSILAVAILLGCWWCDHARLQGQLTRLQRKLNHETEAARFDKMKLLKQLQRPEVIGTAASDFPEIQRCADLMSEEGEGDRVWLKPWLKQIAKEYGGKKGVAYGSFFEPIEKKEGAVCGFAVVTVGDRIVKVVTQEICW